MNPTIRKVAPFIALGALALAACSGGTPVRDPFAPPGTVSNTSEIQIVAENRYFSQVSLYAVTNGRRMRMGSMGGSGTQTFSLTWGAQADLQVEIDSADGFQYVTPAILANPGDVVHLVVESQLNYSRLRR